MPDRCNRRPHVRVGAGRGALLLAVLSGPGLLASDDFEPPPSLKAGDLLPPALANGPRHEVEPVVKGDGFLTAFTVKSSFGEWPALDREMLGVRVAEVYALQQLSEVSKTEMFASALAQAAVGKVKAVARVAADPSGTAKAIPGGLARFAKGLGRSAQGTYDKMTAAKPAPTPDPRTTEQKAKDAAGAAGSTAENLLISGKRREWARKINADPYTTNKALADKLDEVAWVAYSGGFALNFIVPSVPGLGLVENADKVVYETPPGELRKRNAEKLTAAGVSEAAQKALFVNGNFSPLLQTELVDAVASLRGVLGASEVVLLAAESRSEGDARYIRRCVQLLVAGASGVGGFKALTTSENEIEAVAADGRLVLPWSVDYMTWNPDTAPEETPTVQAARAREIWISGVATPRAEQELSTRGFSVLENRARE